MAADLLDVHGLLFKRQQYKGKTIECTLCEHSIVMNNEPSETD